VHPEGLCRNICHHCLVAERKLIEDIALQESGACRIDPIPPDAASVDNGNVGHCSLAERVGKEIADRTLPERRASARLSRGVARVAISTSNSRFNPALYIWTLASIAGSELVFAVSMTRNLATMSDLLRPALE